MQPVIIDFGAFNVFGHSFHLRIYSYGLMLVLGFACALYLARRRARLFGEDVDKITTVGLLALVGGIIGARAAFIIEQWDTYVARGSSPLWEIFNVTSGGLIYYGGLILAMAMVLAYLAIRRMPIRRYLDILAPAVMVGLAFGRMGCLLNGCGYGRRARADYPLAMRFAYAPRPLLMLDKEANVLGSASISPAFGHQVSVGPERGGLGVKDLPGWLFRQDPFGQTAHGLGGKAPVLKSPSELTDEQARQAMKLRSLPVFPAQAFGVANALLISAVLLCFSRLRRREGTVFSLMLILYPITRFALESLRGDNPHNLFRLQFTHNQYTSVGMIAFGLAFWFFLRFLPPDAGPFQPQRQLEFDSRKRETTTRKRKRKH